jgi:hypothetical protein
MKIHALLMTAIASLIIANQAKAQIGWTLDQCKAKYGEAIMEGLGLHDLRLEKGISSYPTPAGETYLFNVSGFKLGIAFARGAAIAVEYDPEVALTLKQAKEILAKNSSTTWKKDAQLSDDEADTLTTKGKHDLLADLYFQTPTFDSPSEANHNSIECIIVQDDTVMTQIQKEGDAADQENKAKKTQDSVNGL